MRVSRSFGHLEVLFDVSLEILPGEIHGLIGPNGVGKTTLLRIMAGLLAPSSGSVRIMGGDPASAHIRKTIGWIPGGDRTFYLRLSGMENLVFFGRMYGLSTSEAKDRGRELLRRVGLARAADRAAGIYSKGMIKRLAVARALISRPAVLLCDETTHDLDPDGSESIRSLFAELGRDGLSVVWATQRLDELASFATQVTVLSETGVAFSGTLDDLVSQIPLRRFQIRFGVEVTDGVAEVLDRLGVRHNMSPTSISVVELSVDETMPVGEVIAELRGSGHLAVSVSEIGSHVEAAYHQVLGGAS